MTYDQYLHKQLEEDILGYWNKKSVVENLRKRNKKGKKFYFLDGPPYTSGRIHLGHAWNKALKDMVLRYKRTMGYDVWDRAGFDMHGLPTEHKVMAKFGLKTKEDIEKFGFEKFAEECRKFCSEMMQMMIKDFQRIGVTLDFSDPYQPISTGYIEAVWSLIKKAYDNDRLYLGKRTLHWDPKDQSALAKHELFYQTVTDDSIYVKFKIEGSSSISATVSKTANKEKQKEKLPKKQAGSLGNEYLVIWTTTPWTIPFDLFIMAHPTIRYAKVKVGSEIWIMAESRVADVMHLKGDKYEIIETFAGKKLEGLRYTHFWKKELPELQELYNENKLVHTVILNEEFVNDAEGTGLVHGAPGSGPEDYEVGYQHHIPPYNCLDESGIFPAEAGRFSGLKARYDDHIFIKAIDDEGALVAKKKYSHDYPHAERSKEAVIFRTTPQWFLKVEDLKEKMIKDNEEIYWFPEKGKNAFRSWLEHLRDNSITKQRFWGTPAPIWQSADGDIIVVGSKEELQRLAKGKVPDDLHKPWIDDVIITKGGKGGTEYQRLPDVMDVWIDPGSASWICLYYPEQKELFKKYFPADFILEGKDQIRAWFNLLFVCSYLYLGKPSFKNVYMHGFITDVDGVKMSKSLGNIISPDELIDKYGADVLRYYMIQTTAGEDINFSWQEAKTKERYLHIFWNIHRLLINLSREHNINPTKIKNVQLGTEEKYILSRLHSTIVKVTDLLEAYRLDEVVAPLEQLYLELSRTYIQMVRDKSSIGTDEEKKACLFTINKVLMDILPMFTIICPFITEAMYLNLKEEFRMKEESISQFPWPVADKSMIDTGLEQDMAVAQEIIASALGAREKAQLGLRWPVKELVVETSDEQTIEAAQHLEEIILQQTNSKQLAIVTALPGVKVKVKPNYGKIGPEFGELSPKIIAKLAIDSPETILSHIDSEGKYSFTVDKKKVNITKEMLEIERTAPANYKQGEIKRGTLYINTDRNQELEQEGYIRELMRHIQSMRKKAGLEKTDRINLSLSVSPMVKKGVEQYQEELKEKVGAERLSLSLPGKAAGKGEQVKSAGKGEVVKIKNESLTVWFEKV